MTDTRKVRTIDGTTHPLEMAKWLEENASRIESALVIADYKDDKGEVLTHQKFYNSTNANTSWWIVSLIAVLVKEIRER